MNNQSQIDYLTDANLDQVSGGMTCDAANALATLYETFADLNNIVGKDGTAAFNMGKAQGIRLGGCGK